MPNPSIVAPIVLGQSIGIDENSTFQFYHQNCRSHSFGRFVGVRVGVASCCCAGISGICMPNPSIVAPIVSEISAFMKDRRTACQIDSARGPDQEYIYFMGSETLPSACYILSDESSIPFYFTSNGYN